MYQRLCQAHRLGDGALGRAGKGAAAAGYAEIHAACLQRIKVLVGKVLRMTTGSRPMGQASMQRPQRMQADGSGRRRHSC